MDRDRNETLAAEELDNFLSTRLSGLQVPLPFSVPIAEAKLADELVSMAEKAAPESAFVASLETSLGRNQKPRRWASFCYGQDLVDWLKKHKALYRVALGLAGLGAVIVLFLLGTRVLFPGQDLPRLPLMEMLSPYTLDAGIDSRRGVPSDIEFVLKTTLPPAPRQARVFQQQDPPLPTIEEAKLWASRFGVEGEVYTSNSYGNTYIVLGDQKRVIFAGAAVFYFNRSLQDISSYPSLPFEQAQPIIKDFVQKHGWPEFPFYIEPCPVQEISLVCLGYLVEGYPVHTASAVGDFFSPFPNIAILAFVIPNGQTLFLAYWPLELKPGLHYPIRSAQEAWEVLLRPDIADRLALYSLYITGPGEPDPMPTPNRWRPQYHPGQHIDVYGVPEIYEPVEHTGLPVIEINSMRVQGSADDLREMGQQKVIQSLHLWGQTRQDAAGGTSLKLEGWQALEADTRTIEFRGTIQRRGELVLLREDKGQEFILLYTPDDLPDGLAVEGWAWQSKRTEQGYPLLEWLTLQTQPEAEPAGLEGTSQANTTPVAMWDWQARTLQAHATVEKVELTYYVVPIAARARQTISPSNPDLLIVQPMWRFAGHIEDGRAFEVLVQAIRDEYLK